MTLLTPCTLMQKLLPLLFVAVKTAVWLPLNQLYHPDPYICTSAFSCTIAQPDGGVDQ